MVPVRGDAKQLTVVCGERKFPVNRCDAIIWTIIIWRCDMIRWAIIFAVIALVLGLLGFGGAASAFAWIAKILFIVAIAIFVLFLVLGVAAGKGIRNAID